MTDFAEYALNNSNNKQEAIEFMKQWLLNDSFLYETFLENILYNAN